MQRAQQRVREDRIWKKKARFWPSNLNVLGEEPFGTKADLSTPIGEKFVLLKGREQPKLKGETVAQQFLIEKFTWREPVRNKKVWPLCCTHKQAIQVNKWLRCPERAWCQKTRNNENELATEETSAHWVWAELRQNHQEKVRELCCSSWNLEKKFWGTRPQQCKNWSQTKQIVRNNTLKEEQKGLNPGNFD